MNHFPLERYPACFYILSYVSQDITNIQIEALVSSKIIAYWIICYDYILRYYQRLSNVSMNGFVLCNIIINQLALSLYYILHDIKHGSVWSSFIKTHMLLHFCIYSLSLRCGTVLHHCTLFVVFFRNGLLKRHFLDEGWKQICICRCKN